MKKKVKQPDFLLLDKIQALAALLRTGNQHAWASHLLRAIQRSQSDAQLRRDMLQFYEGMGSLNEIVLYVDGIPEWKINQDFAVLRADVLARCEGHVAATC